MRLCVAKVSLKNASILHTVKEAEDGDEEERAFGGLTNAPVDLAIAIDDLVLCHLLPRRRRLGLVDPRRFFPLLLGHEAVRARAGRDRRGVPFELVCPRLSSQLLVSQKKGRGYLTDRQRARRSRRRKGSDTAG